MINTAIYLILDTLITYVRVYMPLLQIPKLLSSCDYDNGVQLGHVLSYNWVPI